MSIIVVIIIILAIVELLKVDLVAEKATNTSKSLDELVALGGAVGHELQGGSEVTVLLGNPLEERHGLDNLHLLLGLLVHEQGTVLSLLLLGGVQDDLVSSGILENPAVDLQVLEDDEGLHSTELEGLECVVDTVTDASSVLGDLLEVLSDKLLLLDELDVAEGLGGELDSLVETVLASVGDIDNLDNLDLQSAIKEIGLVQVVLEVRGTGQNDAGNVDLVVGDEVLNCQLGNLTDVVVTLFFTKTGETQRGLSTTAVLLWKIDGELVHNVSGVSAQGTEKSSVTIHDDETELLIILKQLGESLGVELVVAKVEGGVDWAERLEVDVDLSLLSLGGQDFTTIDDETIWWDLVVKLETLLGRGNGGEDGLSVDAGLDVRGSSLWRVSIVRPAGALGRNLRILQPTSLRREKPDPLELQYISKWAVRGRATFTYE